MCANRCASEGCVVTVLLPGAVEAQHEILEERMGFVEDRKPDDVHPLVHHVVQSEQREFLRERNGRENSMHVSYPVTLHHYLL